jgi:HEAT repeat protein
MRLRPGIAQRLIAVQATVIVVLLTYFFVWRRTTAGLEAVFRSSDADRRVAAARLLAEKGSSAASALPTLVRALDDPDPRIRRAAAEAVVAAGGPYGVEIVLKGPSSPEALQVAIRHLLPWMRWDYLPSSR